MKSVPLDIRCALLSQALRKLKPESLAIMASNED
jgi:hypothetical protein